MFLDNLARYCCRRVDHQVFASAWTSLPCSMNLKALFFAAQHLKEQAGSTWTKIFQREVRPDCESGHGHERVRVIAKELHDEVLQAVHYLDAL